MSIPIRFIMPRNGAGPTRYPSKNPARSKAPGLDGKTQKIVLESKENA